MNRLEISTRKLNQVIQDEKLKNFSVFLMQLRKSLGISRTEVSEDLQIAYGKLVELENGSFRKMPHHSILVKLSHYYGVDFDLMKERADYFLKKIGEI